jgi:hypothetical protein
MAEKIMRLGIRGNRDFMLYVSGGAVWRIRKRKAGSSAQKPKPERITDPNLFPMDDDYIYFVDRDGDVSRARREGVVPKAGAKQATQERGQSTPADGEIKRAISIRQPYVEAILDGKKTIEYRSRHTNIRERVYLYASLGLADEATYREFGYEVDRCPRGFIVGSVEIVDCTGEEGEYEIQLARPERLKDFLKPTNQPQPMFWIPQFR